MANGQDIRIIAFDLDGTLLDSEKRLSERNRVALERAAEQGIEIVPTTGRFFQGIPESVRELPFIRYAITINGAQIYDSRDDLIISQAVIPAETAVEMMELLERHDVIYDAYVDNWGLISRRFVGLIEGYVPDPHYIKLMRELRHVIDDLKTYVRDEHKDVQKLIAIAKTEEERALVVREVSEHFPQILVSSSTHFNLEFNIASAHKGEGLKSLVEHLGCSIDNCMAIGDGGNDITMIKMAGIGVAMKNAIPEVISIADEVTDTNDNDGVALSIERLLHF